MRCSALLYSNLLIKTFEAHVPDILLLDFSANYHILLERQKVGQILFNDTYIYIYIYIYIKKRTRSVDGPVGENQVEKPHTGMIQVKNVHV